MFFTVVSNNSAISLCILRTFSPFSVVLNVCVPTAKLFAEMMNLENNVRSFPVVDYKIPTDNSIFENDRIYKQYSRTKARQTDISEFFK